MSGSQPLLLWLLSGTSFSQLYDCSLEASVPAATTVWSPAQQQYYCQKYMQETTYKYAVATSKQSARGIFYMPRHACGLLSLLLLRPLLLWLLSGTSSSQLYDCSRQASVPAATTVWSPAQQQYCCQKYMQETTYKHAVAASKQSAREGFNASSRVPLAGIAPGAAAGDQHWDAEGSS